MPQPKTTPDKNGRTREDIAGAFVSLLFDEAFELNERYETIVADRKTNRDQLRENRRFMDDAQKALLAELYPDRPVTRRTPEERAAYLRAQAEEAERKAAEKSDDAPEPEPEPEPAA